MDTMEDQCIDLNKSGNIYDIALSVTIAFHEAAAAARRTATTIDVIMQRDEEIIKKAHIYANIQKDVFAYKALDFMITALVTDQAAANIILDHPSQDDLENLADALNDIDSDLGEATVLLMSNAMGGQAALINGQPKPRMA